MTDLQTEQHRKAWAAVVEVLPGAGFVSHEVDLDGNEMCSVKMPGSVAWPDGRICGVGPNHCPTCGDPRDVVGLTTKCRDWHEVCNCGNRYDEPKVKGCRRRVYEVDGLSIRVHPLPARPPKEEK